MVHLSQMLLEFSSKLYGIITDCVESVLWHDDVAISGSPEVINMLKKQGKNVYFATNNGTKTRHQLWQRAIALGFDVAEEVLMCPTHLIAEYLQNRNFKQKVYVIGSGAIVKELEAVGIECFGSGPDNLNGRMNQYIEREITGLDAGEVGAVVVAFDEHFSYGKMLKSCNFLTANPDCLFLATNTDGVHRYPMYHIPGTGAILKAVETCSGREALLFGKPNTTFVEALVREGVVLPERTLGIGDCCKIDVTFGRNCGFQTLLVGTGNYQLADVKKLMKNPIENQKLIPDTFLPKLGDLLQYY